jgi:peptidoglycan/LPS O-acetylase OafA/YrhL
LEKAHKFLALDALRGVAALIVAEFHYRVFFSNVFFTHSYLAVDLFFMLSGFVLSFAYQQRLDSGYSVSTFLKTRAVRLYPLYFAGLIFGVVARVWTVREHGHTLQGGFLLPFACSLLMLPVIAGPGYPNPISFPFNFPMWSLFFEMVANVYHAVFLRRRSWIFLAAIMVTTVLYLPFGCWDR